MLQSAGLRSSGPTLPNRGGDRYCPDRKPVNSGSSAMADHIVPHFHNEIGVKEFMCVGAKPPFDHPHVFLVMGDDDEKICPYCSTLYRYKAGLAPIETVPPGHLYRDLAA
jgi:uncharacterized Zn-finger protein